MKMYLLWKSPELTEDLKKPFKLEGILRIDETPVHKAVREAFINLIIHANYLILADRYFYMVYHDGSKLNAINTPMPGSFDEVILEGKRFSTSEMKKDKQHSLIYTVMDGLSAHE